jgi:dynein heavy chain
LEANFTEIPKEEMIEQDLPEFIPPPYGNSQVDDFVLLYHVHLEQEKPKDEEKDKEKDKKKKKEGEEEEEEEEPAENVGYDENKIYNRVVIPRICKLWINKKPAMTNFLNDIIKCIGEGLNAIQAFERWSRHDDMIQYVSVLEEWDDMVGEDWEHPDSNYLNP